MGSTNQVKDGGLSLDALSVFGGGYFQGNVGIGVVTPTETLDVGGGVKVGNSTNANAGTIRWTGVDLEVYNGSEWTSLTAGEAAPAEDPNYTQCINAGGSWIAAQDICYIPGSSCPSGWSQKSSYSSTISGVCSDNNCGAGGCTTGRHTRANTGRETCTFKDKDYIAGRKICSAYTWTRTCSATISEVGCTKN